MLLIPFLGIAQQSETRVTTEEITVENRLHNFVTLPKGTELVVQYHRTGNATAIFPMKPDSNNTSRVYLSKESLEKTKLLSPPVKKQSKLNKILKSEGIKAAFSIAGKIL